MGRTIRHQVCNHVDRLQQVFLECPFPDVTGDSCRQARHAGEHPADVHQQKISDHFVQAVAGKLNGLRLVPLRPLVDGVPEQNRRDHGEEAQNRGQEKVAPVSHAFDQGNPQDLGIFAKSPEDRPVRRTPIRAHRVRPIIRSSARPQFRVSRFCDWLHDEYELPQKGGQSLDPAVGPGRSRRSRYNGRGSCPGPRRRASVPP